MGREPDSSNHPQGILPKVLAANLSQHPVLQVLPTLKRISQVSRDIDGHGVDPQVSPGEVLFQIFSLQRHQVNLVVRRETKPQCTAFLVQWYGCGTGEVGQSHSHLHELSGSTVDDEIDVVVDSTQQKVPHHATHQQRLNLNLPQGVGHSP